MLLLEERQAAITVWFLTVCRNGFCKSFADAAPQIERLICARS
jgi:hypothetical protein